MTGSLRCSQVYFSSYWRKAIIKMLIATLFLCIFVVMFWSQVYTNAVYHCEIQDQFYQCLGSPGKFLEVCLCCYGGLLLLYIVCNFNMLSQFYREYIRETGKDGTDDIFYRGSDIRIF